jgi:hypothetical protein
MSKSTELNTFERESKEATDRFESLQAYIRAIYNDISLAEFVKKNLEENIHILKSRHIIPVAVEYRKAKEDLEKVLKNLHSMEVTKNNLESSAIKARKFMVECRDRYLACIETQTCKVIEGNFGRNDDDRQDGNST